MLLLFFLFLLNHNSSSEHRCPRRPSSSSPPRSRPTRRRARLSLRLHARVPPFEHPDPPSELLRRRTIDIPSRSSSYRLEAFPADLRARGSLSQSPAVPSQLIRLVDPFPIDVLAREDISQGRSEVRMRVLATQRRAGRGLRGGSKDMSRFMCDEYGGSMVGRVGVVRVEGRAGGEGGTKVA